MSKTFLFQAIQFTQIIQFSISMLLVIFNPEIGPPYQVLPRRARVDLGAMAMKGGSADNFKWPVQLVYGDWLINFKGMSSRLMSFYA